MSMSFLCTSCDCPFPMSYDDEKTIDNIWIHLNGNQHDENRKCYRSTIKCLLCNEKVSSSGNPRIDGHKAENHLNHYKHQMKVDEHYDSYANEDSRSDSWYDSDDYDDESEEGNDNWFFYCNVCSCNVRVSSDRKTTMKQLKFHIRGQKHRSNIICPGIDKSMRCESCDRQIPVSVNINSSIRNLRQHIKSC